MVRKCHTNFNWITRRNVFTAFGLIVVGMSLATVNFLVGKRALNESRQNDFESISVLYSEVFENVVENQILNERTLTILMENRQTSRELFNEISNSFLIQSDVSGAFGFAPKILDETRTEFEIEQTNYWEPIIGRITVITERNGDGILVPSTTKPFYYPVTYIEPVIGNEPAILFDLYSVKNRRETIDAAVKEKGKSIFTPRVQLVQDSKEGSESSYGVLLISSTLVEDCISLVMRINEVLLQTFAFSNVDDGILVDLKDLTSNEFLGSIVIEDGIATVVGEIEFTEIEQTLAGKLYYSKDYNFGNRLWKIEIQSTNNFNPIRLDTVVTTTIMIIIVFIAITIFYLLLIYKIEQKHVYIKNQLRTGYTKWMGYMCHSIRGPVHTINYLADTLVKMGEDGKTEVRKLELLLANTNQLFDLINSYIDFTTLDTRDVTLTRRSTDVCSIAENIFHEYSIMSSDSVKMIKNIHSSAIGTNLYIDSLRFRQILSNSLSNSTKFTNKGSIELIIKIEDETVIKFIIRDTGPGLRGNDEEKLFKDYQQGEYPAKSKDKTVASSGLGLSISSYLAELMKGTVTLKNRTDGIRGTVFELTLPYIPVPPSEEALSDFDSNSNSNTVREIKLPRMFSEVRVYACEDDFTHRYTLIDMLQSFGICKENIITFSEGEELLEYMNDPSTRTPHIVLLDIFMKRMNGDEIFEELKRMKYTGPTIAITGNVINTQDYLDQGFDVVLTKPYKADHLKDVLEHLLFSVV